MTVDEFKDRGVEAALPKGGAKSLDPVSLAVLTAALISAATTLASECVHSLFAKDARNPTFRQRVRVRWHHARKAVAAALEATPGSDHVDAWYMAELTAKGLLGVGKDIADDQFENLKRNLLTGHTE